MSSSAVTRCTVPGGKWKHAPAVTTSSSSASWPASPSSSRARPLCDVPALVLLPVELQRERLALPHEQHLPDVGVGVRPDQLPAPRLLDPPRLERETVEGAVVRRVEAHASCLCGPPAGVLVDELGGAAEILRRVHREPDALVPVRVQPSLLRELREGRLLVVALLRQERERLLAEHVDAGVDPVRRAAAPRGSR